MGADNSSPSSHLLQPTTNKGKTFPAGPLKKIPKKDSSSPLLDHAAIFDNANGLYYEKEKGVLGRK